MDMVDMALLKRVVVVAGNNQRALTNKHHGAYNLCS
jgi:hypothetical protein